MVWWRGFFGEDQMTDEDWEERGTNAAKSMLNGLSPNQSNPDGEGAPTYGWYNGDYSEEEHRRANYLADEDPEYAEQQRQGAEQLRGFMRWCRGDSDEDEDEEE